MHSGFLPVVSNYALQTAASILTHSAVVYCGRSIIFFMICYRHVCADHNVTIHPQWGWSNRFSFPPKNFFDIRATDVW